MSINSQITEEDTHCLTPGHVSGVVIFPPERRTPFWRLRSAGSTQNALCDMLVQKYVNINRAAHVRLKFSIQLVVVHLRHLSKAYISQSSALGGEETR